MSFGRELVVLLTKPSVGWRFEQRTFYIGSWRVKLILACQDAKMSLALHEPIQNNQLPIKTHVALKDNSIFAQNNQDPTTMVVNHIY
jgi:hypothetical protein